MPKSKGQPTVYVSSTFIDLEGHRAALKTALEKACYDVECMEKYTAFDERPLDRCLADVAATDVYVLLIAHRYGYRPQENNPQRRSITQLEYEEASRHNKPRLVFTVDRKQLWLPEWIDGGDDAADLVTFQAEVEASHGIERFTTPDQLASLVLQALQDLRPPSLDSGSPRTRTYTPGDLQRWVDRHHVCLSEAILGLASVQASQVHVPLDVCLTLAGAAVTEGPRLLRPEDLEPCWRRQAVMCCCPTAMAARERRAWPSRSPAGSWRENPAAWCACRKRARRGHECAGKVKNIERVCLGRLIRPYGHLLQTSIGVESPKPA